MIFLLFVAFIIGVLVGIGITYGDELYIKWRQRVYARKWLRSQWTPEEIEMMKKQDKPAPEFNMIQEECQKTAEDIKEFWENQKKYFKDWYEFSTIWGKNENSSPDSKS